MAGVYLKKAVLFDEKHCTLGREAILQERRLGR